MTDYQRDAQAFIRQFPELAKEVARQVRASERVSETPVSLTPRQLECLNFIRSYSEEHGYAPSYSEIMPALGISSKSSVSRLVVGLQVRGHINRIKGLNRTLALRHVAQ